MVFNGNGIAEILFFVLLAWIIGLSLLVFRMVRHYNRLAGGVNNATLRNVLEELLTKQKSLQSDQKELLTALEKVRKDGSLHVQRMGLIRFNPFSDTGGSQSFTLAILDGQASGLVMTSLFARNGHRWYVKEVVSGKGKEMVLSKEEQAAIKKAYE